MLACLDAAAPALHAARDHGASPRPTAPPFAPRLTEDSERLPRPLILAAARQAQALALPRRAVPRPGYQRVPARRASAAFAHPPAKTPPRGLSGSAVVLQACLYLPGPTSAHACLFRPHTFPAPSRCHLALGARASVFDWVTGPPCWPFVHACGAPLCKAAPGGAVGQRQTWECGTACGGAAPATGHFGRRMDGVLLSHAPGAASTCHA